MTVKTVGHALCVRKFGHIAVIEVKPRSLDDACGPLSAAVDRLLHTDCLDIVIDLGHVSRSGDRGGGELLGCFVNVRQLGGRLRVHRVPDTVRTLVAQTRADGTLLHILDRKVIDSLPSGAGQADGADCTIVDDRPGSGQDAGKAAHVPSTRLDIVDGDIGLVAFSHGFLLNEPSVESYRERLHSLLEDAVAQGFNLFIFDSRDVKRIDSLGFGVIVAATLSVTQRQRYGAWVVGACLRHLLKVVRMRPVAPAFATIDEATAYLRAQPVPQRTSPARRPTRAPRPWRTILTLLGRRGG